MISANTLPAVVPKVVKQIVAVVLALIEKTFVPLFVLLPVIGSIIFAVFGPGFLIQYFLSNPLTMEEDKLAVTLATGDILYAVCCPLPVPDKSNVYVLDTPFMLLDVLFIVLKFIKVLASSVSTAMWLNLESYVEVIVKQVISALPILDMVLKFLSILPKATRKESPVPSFGVVPMLMSENVKAIVN